MDSHSGWPEEPVTLGLALRRRPAGDFGAPASSSRSFLWGFGCHEGNPSSHNRFNSCSLFRTSPHTTAFDSIFQLGPFRSLFGARFNLLRFFLSPPLAATSFCPSDRDIMLRGWLLSLWTVLASPCHFNAPLLNREYRFRASTICSVFRSLGFLVAFERPLLVKRFWRRLHVIYNTFWRFWKQEFFGRQLSFEEWILDYIQNFRSPGRDWLQLEDLAVCGPEYS